MPSKKDAATVFFWQNASARPMMMQLTTIRGMNTPRASLSAGTNACRSRSTMVTKPAITTTKIASLISLGMIFLIAATTTLQQVRMMRTERPIPTPLNRLVVIAMVAHIPMSCTRTGLLVIRPSLNCFLMFI